jgi:hypothetical protein
MVLKHDAGHKLTHGMNSFLDSKEGQDLNDKLLKDTDPALHAQIQGQVALHRKVKKAMAGKKGKPAPTMNTNSGDGTFPSGQDPSSLPPQF